MVINIIHIDPDQQIDPYANPELKEKIKEWRNEDALSIVRQSKLYGFAVRFWAANTDETVFRSGNITRAFKKIVRDAKDNDYPFVIIGEQDLQFTSQGAWQYYLDNMPQDYDIFLGGIYAGQLQENRIVNGYSGHTLITVHKNFYDFFLSANEDPLGLGQGHCDRWCGNFCFEKKYIVCLPFVVKNKAGYSENHRRLQTYEAYEENWEYYTG